MGKLKKETKKLKKFFESKNINVYKHKGSLELNTYTKGGVNMIITLNPPVTESFQEYVDMFDVDEEIDLHREMDMYKHNFTIRQSLDDFENYLEWLESLLKELENG